MRPPPTSTLFPYTTLFRSHDHVELPRSQAQLLTALRAQRKHDHEDRKSTRLNSSHEWISYAVFCLKKKNVRVGRGPAAGDVEDEVLEMADPVPHVVTEDPE